MLLVLRNGVHVKGTVTYENCLIQVERVREDKDRLQLRIKYHSEPFFILCNDPEDTEKDYFTSLAQKLIDDMYVAYMRGDKTYEILDKVVRINNEICAL